MSKKDENFEDSVKRYFEIRKKDLESQIEKDEGIGKIYNDFFSNLPADSKKYLGNYIDGSLMLASQISIMMRSACVDDSIRTDLSTKLDLAKNASKTPSEENN